MTRHIRSRQLLTAAVSVGSLLLTGGPAAPMSGDSATSSRDITLTYRAKIQDLPQDAGEVQVWVPLASSRDRQEILRREVRAPAGYTITRDPVYQNDILHFSLTPPVQEPLEVEINYEVRLGQEVDTGAPQLPTADLQRYLEPSGLVIVDDEIRARAREATAGRTTLTDRARGIYDYVIRHMTYDKTTPGWGRGDTRRACLIGKGNCTDFHSLFISMARAEHIPARFKIGLVVPPGSSGEIPGYHCWAEIYVEGQGWVPVDASEAWKRPERTDYYFGGREPNRVLISVGRDIELVPPQRDKPVNIFLAPYIEVNGRAFEHVKTEFRFQERLHNQEVVG